MTDGYLKTTVLIGRETYGRVKDIAYNYFGNVNSFLIEAVREGLRDFERFDPGDVPRRRYAELYIEKHGGGKAGANPLHVCLRLPPGLCDRVWEVHAEPFTRIFRIWVNMFLEHPRSYWEGRPCHDCSGCPECMVLMSTHPARAVPDPNSETCTGCRHYWDYRQEGKA